MAEPVIRELAWSDFPACVENYLALYDEVRENPDLGVTLLEKPPTFAEEIDWFAQLFRAVHTGDAVSCVADVGGRAVGICTVRRKGPSYEARHFGGLGIFVAKEWRGRGLGRSLVQDVLKRCRGRFEFVELSVFATNGRARELYRSLGFRTWGTLPQAILRDGRYTDSEHMVAKIEP